MAFWDNIRFPYFNMQELNLDWIMRELKRITGFMPQDGNVGDILTRKSDGASWEPPEAVNININALPEDTEIGENDQLIFYDISAQANRKIKPPNLLDSMMSNGTPLMDGTASPGTSKKPARYDHKHPTDTSRQAALTGVQMNAVNSGAPASCFDGNGVLKPANGGHVPAHWGSYESVSFPFTPTADGVVTVYADPTDPEQTMLVYILDSDSHYVLSIETTIGAKGAGSFPVKAGVTYRIAYSSNVSAISPGYRALY